MLFGIVGNCSVVGVVHTEASFKPLKMCVWLFTTTLNSGSSSDGGCYIASIFCW